MYVNNITINAFKYSNYISFQNIIKRNTYGIRLIIDEMMQKTFIIKRCPPRIDASAGMDCSMGTWTMRGNCTILFPAQ